MIWYKDMLRDCPLSFGAGLEMLPMRSRYFTLLPIISDDGNDDDDERRGGGG